MVIRTKDTQIAVAIGLSVIATPINKPIAYNIATLACSILVENLHTKTSFHENFVSVSVFVLTEITFSR